MSGAPCLEQRPHGAQQRGIPRTPLSRIAPLYQHQVAVRGEAVTQPNRLLTALPRRSNQQCPQQAAVGPKKSKTVLQKLLGKLKANDGETVKAINQLNDKQHQRIQEQRESYMRCLQLAVDCGIDEASEEYFFLHDHFKDERERDAYLSLKTHEARRIWIQRAFERRR